MSNILLVGIGGVRKGSAWVVGEDPVILGRDLDCGIRLHDPLVSRKHCRIVCRDQAVFLECLGARNPALVNGTPRKKATLRVGDVLAVGRDQFQVALMNHLDAGEGAPVSDQTMSLGQVLSIRLTDGDSKVVLENRPGTLEKLVFLFETTNSLTSCSTTEEVLDTVVLSCAGHFEAAAVWIARALPQQEQPFITWQSPEAQEVGVPAPEQIGNVIEDRNVILSPESLTRDGQTIWRSTLIAPLAIGEVSIGALAVQSDPSRALYDENDLRFLQLYAQACAPFVHSVGVIEQLWRDNERLQIRAGEPLELIGESEAISRVREQIAQAARSELSVLISGETGTGKELVARLIHGQSARSSGPWVVVNCAAIPDELFESQVFGHRKGAFTGAHESFEGLLAQADGGTLFLDEIGDLSLQNQARILRAIEYGTFRRMGAKEETQVDVRVLAATNKNLLEHMREGMFREDLFHRLNGFELAIPPLRERLDDVIPLARYFFERAKASAPRVLEGIAPEALPCLAQRTWPGNVRELRNCVLRAISVAQQDVIQREDFARTCSSCEPVAASETHLLKEWEKRHIATVLHNCDGNVRQAAQQLGIGLSTLYKKLAAFDIKPQHSSA